MTSHARSITAPLVGSVIAALVGAGVGPALAESYDAQHVKITRFIGVVDIQAGGVDRVSVEYDNGEGLVDAPDFHVDGDTLEIEQVARFTDINCRSRNGGRSIAIGRRGDYAPIAAYGRLVVRVPDGAEVALRGGAADGVIGDVGELDLGLSSCSDITAGDVAGDAEVAVNGSGDIEVGQVGGDLDAAVNGSGDIHIGSVAGSLNLAINGSGTIDVARVNGNIDAAIRGSGDIVIRGGEAPVLDVAVMGSGDVRFDGVAGDVELAAMGSGDVYVSEVTGETDTVALGSGRIHIGRR